RTVREREAPGLADRFARLQARGKGGTKQIPPPRPPTAANEDRTESMVRRPPPRGEEAHSEGTVWVCFSEMFSGSQPASPPALRAKAEPARPAPAANNRPPPSRRSPPAAALVRAVPYAREWSAH